MRSIFDELRIRAVENDAVVNDRFQRFEVFSIEGHDCYFGEHRFGALRTLVNRELADLEGATVEVFSLATLKDEDNEAATAAPEILKSTRARFLKGKRLKRIEKYACVTTDGKGSALPTVPVKSDLHRNFFEIGGVKAERLGTARIKELLYRLLNFDGSYRAVASMTLKEALLQSQVRYTESHVRIGEFYVKVLSCRHLPDDLNDFDVDRVMDELQDVEFLHSSSFTILNQKSAAGALTLMRNVSQTTVEQVDADGRVKRGPTNHDAKLQFEESDRLKEHLAKHGDAFVVTAQKVILWNRSAEKLEEDAIRTVNALKKAAFYFFEEEYLHDKEFFKSLPGCTVFTERGHKALSYNALSLLPLSRIPRGDVSEPYPLTVRTKFGTLYGYDVFSSRRMPWNLMVLGATGSGKSVFMNELIIHSVYPRIKKEGGRCFIIDFAGAENSSYTKLVSLFGGKFIALDASGRYAINPFPKRDAIARGGDFDPAQLTFLQIVVDMAVGNMGDAPANNLKRILVSKALAALYREVEEPRLEHLIPYLEQLAVEDEEDRRHRSELVKLLRGFVASPESRLVNSATTVDYGDAPFVVVDLQGISTLTDRLRQLMTFIVVQEARKVAFKAKGYKTIVMDEVAQLIKEPRMISLVDELYSTVRKYNAQIFTITQNYQSYKESGLSSKIKLNTTTTIILSHAEAREAKRLVAEDFGLSEFEKKEFDELRTVKRQYSMALIKTTAGDRPEAATLRIELSPFEYWLVTSDRSDNEHLERIAKEKNCSIIQACFEAAAGKI